MSTQGRYEFIWQGGPRLGAGHTLLFGKGSSRMAQSLASIPYVGEAGGLRDWESPAYGAEIPSIAIWSWRPVAPARPESQAPTDPQAATKITQVLAAWRAAERQLHDLLETSPMRTLIRSDVARLRAEYQRLFALANR